MAMTIALTTTLTDDPTTFHLMLIFIGIGALALVGLASVACAQPVDKDWTGSP